MMLITTDDGGVLDVRVSGSGPPIVLLHEWASSERVWQPVVQRLEERFTTYRWTARGHGQGVGSAEPLSITRLALDLACVLEQLRLPEPTVVGHSMGALTLWAYILHRGCAALGRVVVIDQSPKLMTDRGWRLGIYGDWTAERDAGFVAEMRRDFTEAVLRLIACGLNETARARVESGHPGLQRFRAYLQALDPQPLIDVWPTLSHADFRPALAATEVPALLIYGGESTFYPAETGPWVRAAIGTAARLEVYEGADHSPHIGCCDRFTADLARFALG